MAPRLLPLLLEALPPERRAEVEALPQLEALLAERYEAGRVLWASMKVSPRAWAVQLARHLPAQKAQAAVAELHADFYLAVGLMLGDSAAFDTFKRVYAPKLLAAVRRKGASEVQAEHVLSVLEERLFVAGPNGQRIASYAGRSSLERFLRVAAVNQHLDFARVAPKVDELDEAMGGALLESKASPELAALRRDSATAFAAAFRRAFNALEPRERVLLRMHTFESATIDDIGRLYRVHRVTAFRWLETARAHLKQATQAALREALALQPDEVNSLLRQLPSTMELSLKTLFASAEQS